MARIKWVFMSVLVIGLVGCNMDYALPTGEPIELTVFKSGQVLAQKRLGETDDPIRQAVDAWLAANKSGWHYAVMTRPAEIYLKGKDFSINVQEAEVSVKYCRGSLNCHFWIKKDAALYPELQRLTH